MKFLLIIPIVVSLGGLVVMAGWYMDIDVLKSVVPGFVTMKFTTALSFFFSGLILFFVGRQISHGDSILNALVLSSSSLIIFLVMLTILVSVFLGVRTGIEDLFVQETTIDELTTVPGRPSTGTMINFILIAVVAMLAALEFPAGGRFIKQIGYVITFISSMSLIGYIFDVPFLYYAVTDLSTAMALHTTILFLLIGLFLIVVPKKIHK